MDLVDLLRGREGATISELASELGVTERTVHRDLALLRERGMPISGEAGPGGGVRLERDRGVTAVHLTTSEVVSLWLSARLSRAGSDLPWSAEARSAMAKLLSSLPRDKGRELRAVCRRVVVGPPAGPRVREGAGAPPAALLGLFERAFTTGVALAFSYTDREGRETLRRIEPHGLLVEPPVWYIVARDIDKAAPRTFRMDRIASPRLLPEHRFRPDAAILDAQLPDRERWKPLAA
jgi:predicted DNA-binding transcriptional regulator YafY